MEQRSVPRGVLWMVVGGSGTIIMLLLTLVISMAGGWAQSLESRSVDTQLRVQSLESELAAVKEWKESNSMDHEEIKRMIRDLAQTKQK